MKYQNGTLWGMQEFERVFGKAPRVRMVEAILRLAPDEFTRPEAAREAGLHKPSANRILAALERDGVIELAGRRPIRYGVSDRLALIEILGLTASALRLERRHRGETGYQRRLKRSLQRRYAERASGSERPPLGRSPDPILHLRGLGKVVWRGVDPDTYVEELRRGRERLKPSGRANR